MVQFFFFFLPTKNDQGKPVLLSGFNLNIAHSSFNLLQTFSEFHFTDPVSLFVILYAQILQRKKLLWDILNTNSAVSLPQTQSTRGDVLCIMYIKHVTEKNLGLFLLGLYTLVCILALKKHESRKVNNLLGLKHFKTRSPCAVTYLPEKEISPCEWAVKYDPHHIPDERLSWPVCRSYSSGQWECWEESQSLFPCTITSTESTASCKKKKKWRIVELFDNQGINKPNAWAKILRSFSIRFNRLHP